MVKTRDVRCFNSEDWPRFMEGFYHILNIFLYQNLTKFCPNPSFPTAFAFFDNDEIQNLTLCLLWLIFFFSSLKRNKWQNGMNFGEMMWSESSRFCIVRVGAVTEGQKRERGTRSETEQACWSCELHFLRITISSNKLVQFRVAGVFLEWGWGGGYKPRFIFFSSVFGICNQPHLLSVFQR